MEASADSGALDTGQPCGNNQRVIRPLLLSALFLVLIPGCGRNRHEPLIINSLDGPTAVGVRDTARFRCAASQWRPGPLDFAWACSTGRLEWNEGHSVRWRAPETSGRALLSVTVSDSLGNSACETLRLSVRKRVVWPIIWDAAVKPRSYVHWADSMWAGYVLSGRSGADSANPVFLLVMEDVEFRKWASGLPAQYVVRRLCYKDGLFTDTLKSTGLFQLVIDNTLSPAETNFWVRISLTSP